MSEKYLSPHENTYYILLDGNPEWTEAEKRIAEEYISLYNAYTNATKQFNQTILNRSIGLSSDYVSKYIREEIIKVTQIENRLNQLDETEEIRNIIHLRYKDEPWGTDWM